MKATKFRKNFTLVELLVVIAIIAILMSLLLPSLKKARDKAKEIICLGNLRQLGSTVQSYIDDWDETFPNLGDAHIGSVFFLPWMDELNARIKKKDVFQCPMYKVDWTTTDTWPTSWPVYYGYNANLGPSFSYGAPKTLWVSSKSVRKPASMLVICDSLNANLVYKNGYFRLTDAWKLMLLGFIGLGVGIGIGIGIEYYSHTSIPTCPAVASERRGIPIVRRGGTPSEANPTYAFST